MLKRLLGLLGGGYVPLALAAALLASAGFAWLQTARLGASQTAVTALEGSNKLMSDRIADDARMIAQRDSLIDKQNVAVAAIGAASAANRHAYVARIATAEGQASSLRRDAAAILQASTTATDEVGRCRAAFELMTEELKKD